MRSSGWLYVFLANVFFACVSFSIALPTLYGYLTGLGGDPLGSPSLFYALTVSIYSCGEAAGKSKPDKALRLARSDTRDC